LQQPDYGHREKTIVLPQDDAFYKFNQAIQTEGKMKGLESNMTILHSRFAEVRRGHAQTEEIKLSQINLAPKLD